jgi:hypothetical protein
MRKVSVPRVNGNTHRFLTSLAALVTIGVLGGPMIVAAVEKLLTLIAG